VSRRRVGPPEAAAVHPSLVDAVREMAVSLREARERLACRIEEAEQFTFGASRDAIVQVSPRTKLVLRAGRLFLCRENRDPIGFADACRLSAAEVPGWILLEAAKRMPELRGTLEP
jgi:hypothetical protein